MCLSTPLSTTTPGEQRRFNNRSRVHNIGAEEQEEWEDAYVSSLQLNNETGDVLSINHCRDLPHFNVKVNGTQFRFLADSGSTINVLSQEDFNSILPKPVLRSTNRTIRVYGVQSSIPVVGIFCADVTDGQNSIKTELCVVAGKERPVFGWDACKKLKLLDSVNPLGTS